MVKKMTKKMTMEKNFIWLGPTSVLVFVVVLAVMYGLIGTAETMTGGGEPPERPELNLVQQTQTQLTNTPVTMPSGIGNGQNLSLIHQPTSMPSGIGNGQIQLINKPAINSGLGQGQNLSLIHQPTSMPSGIGNGQIQLINNPAINSGLGQGQNLSLIHNPTTMPSGIGNGNIRLINKPTFNTGLGQGQNLQLIKQNLPVIPFFGVSVGEVPEIVARQLNLRPGVGQYIKNILPKSPADKGGLRMGDVILQFDHQDITAHEQIGLILKTKQVGDSVKVLIKRRKLKKSYHIKLEKSPQNIVKAAFTQKPNWMGTDIQDIDAIMKLQFNLPDNRGAIISHVTPNSPADTAGLKTGDVIRRIDGKRILDVKQMQSIILKKQPGKQVQLTILRNGKHSTLNIVMGQKSLAKPQIPFIGPADIAIEGSWIGMDVTELSPNDAKAMGLGSGTRGILVNDVESPPATMVGFQTGDVILAVNGIPTPDMKQFVAATKKQNNAVVDVARGNKHFFISVPPPGFTNQGTKINDPMNNKLKQVALTAPINNNGLVNQNLGSQLFLHQMPVRIAIFTSSPDINARVSGNVNQNPGIIIADLTKNAYASINPDINGTLSAALMQYNISALIGTDISGQTQMDMANNGITIYKGIVGTALDAVALYESNKLTPSGL